MLRPTPPNINILLLMRKNYLISSPFIAKVTKKEIYTSHCCIYTFMWGLLNSTDMCSLWQWWLFLGRYLYVIYIFRYPYKYIDIFKQGLLCSPSWPGSGYQGQAGLRLTDILLPLSPECGGWRNVQPCLAFWTFWDRLVYEIFSFKSHVRTKVRIFVILLALKKSQW